MPLSLLLAQAVCCHAYALCLGTRRGLYEMHDPLTLSVQDRQHAIGTYSWPMAWQGSWGDISSPTTFTVTLSNRKTISNWGIGGFAMGIIQGHLTYKGRPLTLYGFGELLI
jgi:hypothetical protein